MLYAVLFEDDPSRANMRARHMGEHLAFLASNARSIRAAGPLKDASDGSPAGGLWLVDADSLQAVQSITRSDPFWPTGLRKSVRILEWMQVFSDGEQRI